VEELLGGVDRRQKGGADAERDERDKSRLADTSEKDCDCGVKEGAGEG